MYWLTRHFVGESLRAKVLKSSSITFITYGIEQALRLASNLILTRILYPDAFGIMALASTFLIGLNMLSDVGIEQSLIQNKDSKSKNFRNTAWVTKIIRGFVLWILTCLIAYPTSEFYNEPILFPLLSALGFTLAIKGFATTSFAISNKELKIFKLSIVNLLTQVITIVATILFAFQTKSVWALVWGNLIGSLLHVVFGHIYLNDGFKHQFKIDVKSMRQIISFGKWILLGSVFGFVANQADKLIIGKMLSISELGIFTIAMTLAQVPRTILFSMHRSVLLPVYSKIQEEQQGEIRKKVLRSKLLIISLLLPVALAFLVAGNQIISVLYDVRYENAGWMLQILAFGVAVQIVTDVGPFYLGFGKANLFAFTVAVRATLLVTSMIIGGLYLGAIGLVLGISISAIVYYLLEMTLLIKFKIWFWKADIFFISVIFLIGILTYNYNHS